MNRDCFFSIIIPTYNSERYIKKALASVSSQLFRRFEVVIVDGLSHDDTLEIVEEFQEFMPIKCIVEHDKGIYDAMNKGLCIADGEVIYFLGSDDYLADNYVLQEVYDKYQDNMSLDIVYGHINRYKLGDETSILKKTFNISKSRLYNKLKLLRYLGICHQAIFSKKELLISGFSLEYHLASDFDWLCTVVLERKRFLRLNKVIAFYNTTGESSNEKTKLFWELYLIIGKKLGLTWSKAFLVIRKKRWLKE